MVEKVSGMDAGHTLGPFEVITSTKIITFRRPCVDLS